jgi:hypothetical protein
MHRLAWHFVIVLLLLLLLLMLLLADAAWGAFITSHWAISWKGEAATLAAAAAAVQLAGCSLLFGCCLRQVEMQVEMQRVVM